MRRLGLVISALLHQINPDHSKTAPNQTDIRNVPTPTYFLSTFSYYTKEKEAFGPANIRNR